MEGAADEFWAGGEDGGGRFVEEGAREGFEEAFVDWGGEGEVVEGVDVGGGELVEEFEVDVVWEDGEGVHGCVWVVWMRGVVQKGEYAV